MIIVGTQEIIQTIAIVSSAHTSTNVVVTKEKKMTNKEASNVLRLFANLIEINGLPEERILTFRKAYEQAISKLESDTTPQGEFTDLERKVIADSINYLLGAELLEENGYTEEVVNALKSVLQKIGAEKNHL